ncbi:imidazoleglycerol-phosphate dehydratase [Pseudoglutamicibacter albus]|nr:imidazoleglycerol-phosphate dehydratase [Pseudoglutamicibacter albus]
MRRRASAHHMKKASTMSAQLIGTREATMERITSESTVKVTIKLDGTGQADISTTVPFYDHMLTSLARHSLMDITIAAHGDTDIDVHHTVEDTAITLGEVFKTALGDKRGITRFGQATIPLDEALARCIVDLSGRPYVIHEGEPEGQQYHLIGGHFTGSMTRHVFESFAYHAGICLHIDVLRGRDPHHIVECQFKALARALREAIEPDERMGNTIPSTKGAL